MGVFFFFKGFLVEFWVVLGVIVWGYFFDCCVVFFFCECAVFFDYGYHVFYLFGYAAGVFFCHFFYFGVGFV